MTSIHRPRACAWMLEAWISASLADMRDYVGHFVPRFPGCSRGWVVDTGELPATCHGGTRSYAVEIATYRGPLGVVDVSRRQARDARSLPADRPFPMTVKRKE